MNTSKMSAIYKCDVLEWAAYHLVIYTMYASKSELVTKISHLNKHYRGTGTLSKPNSSISQQQISTPSNTVLL